MRIKRLFSAIAAAVLCIQGVTLSNAFAEDATEEQPAEPPVAEDVIGDIDSDGKITAIDASTLLNTYTELSSGRIEIDQDKLKVLDIDQSGRIEASDASLLLKYYVYITDGNEPDFDEYLNYLDELEKERAAAEITTTTTTTTTTATTTSSVMLDVMEFCQYPEYPTGCESAALYMLLKYYDVDVTMEQIVEALPKGSNPYYKNGVLYGADPEKEFVGDPRNNWSYGVFNEPIAKVAEKFKSGVKTKTGATFTDIMNILNSGNPLEVWFCYDPEVDITYTDSWIDPATGKTIRWPRGEHAIVVCGHDDSTITYRDPITGSSRTVSNARFITVFKQMGSRIVYYDE